MFRYYSRNYWRWGFASRLYDWLTPEAYLDSLHRAVESTSPGEGEIWLDAGCGSGLLVRNLKNRRIKYVGMDIQESGLRALTGKAGGLAMRRFLCLQADLKSAVPLREKSVDVVMSHFSVYTLRDRDHRRQVYEEFKRVLKPSGLLVVVNPGRNYDAGTIITESLGRVRERRGAWAARIKQWIVYPWTRGFGLNFIESQLRAGVWHACSLEELSREIEEAGFVIKETRSVYAGCAHLVVGAPS